MTVRSRPTRVLPYLLAFVLGVGAPFLAACGSENPAMLPQLNANRLKGDLDEVVSAVDATDCARTDRALAQLAADYAALPATTSIRLKNRLKEGIDRLGEQAGRECRDTETETTETQTTETVTTETQTTTIPTTTVDTTPTVPTTTDSIPTTETEPTTTDSIPTTTAETGGAGTP